MPRVGSTVTSWLGVYESTPLRVEIPRSVDDLRLTLKHVVEAGEPYNYVGSSHSYNGIQCVDGNVVIWFDGSSLKDIHYDPETTHVTVECGVTIEELKRYLLGYGRQLLTSGNYMKQKVVSALLTGTHGYDGEYAIMADGIVSAEVLAEDGTIVTVEDAEELLYLRISMGYAGPVLRLTLLTAPCRQFRIRQDLFRLSELPEYLDEVDTRPHALTLFHYSDPEDPVVGCVDLTRLDSPEEPTRVHRSIAIISAYRWLVIRFLWHADERFPWTRPIVQRIARLLVDVRVADIITSPNDLDYLYDPSPLLESERDPVIIRQLFSSTYTGYNIAYFIDRAELPEHLAFLSDLANRLRSVRPRRYFKNSIGIRYVGTSERCALAGNYGRDSYSIDLYFDPLDRVLAKRVQEEVFSCYTARPHWGKTILTDEITENTPAGAIAGLGRLRHRFSPSGLLRPGVHPLFSRAAARS